MKIIFLSKICRKDNKYYIILKNPLKIRNIDDLNKKNIKIEI